MRDRAGMLIACNPLPGVGGLTSLTALVARCNYGINRLPNDLGSLSLLEYLDVSKNMLWSLPPQVGDTHYYTWVLTSSHLHVACVHGVLYIDCNRGFFSANCKSTMGLLQAGRLQQRYVSLDLLYCYICQYNRAGLFNIMCGYGIHRHGTSTGTASHSSMCVCLCCWKSHSKSISNLTIFACVSAKHTVQ